MAGCLRRMFGGEGEVRALWVKFMGLRRRRAHRGDVRKSV